MKNPQIISHGMKNSIVPKILITSVIPITIIFKALERKAGVFDDNKG